MLSNFDLERLAEFYNLPLVAVAMKDELPATVKDGCYIINLQSSTSGSGTHWLGLFIYKSNAYYFDSFGAPPSVEIIKFVKKRKGCHLYYNNFIIQDLKSGNCGFYALAFLLWCFSYILLSKDMKNMFSDFVNTFVDDTKENDKILKEFFETSVKQNRPSVLSRFLK
jgi:hypothetical protein